MPVSAATCLNLSRKLTNLNRGLHSMHGDQHAIQKRLLMTMLTGSNVDGYLDLIWARLVNDTKHWFGSGSVRLLRQMRVITLRSASCVLFGDRFAEADDSGLVLLLGTYFQLRREASSPGKSLDKMSLRQLETIGDSLDTLLRAFVRDRRSH